MGPALLFLGVVSTFASMQASSQEAAARGKQIEAQRNIAITKQKREKRNQLRAARKAQAEITAQGVAQGGTAGAPSSAVSGGIAGVGSQYAYNLSFLDQVGAFNQEAFSASQDAAEAGSRAKTFGAAAGVAFKFAD